MSYKTPSSLPNMEVIDEIDQYLDCERGGRGLQAVSSGLESGEWSNDNADFGNCQFEIDKRPGKERRRYSGKNIIALGRFLEFRE